MSIVSTTDTAAAKRTPLGILRGRNPRSRIRASPA